MSGKKAAKSKLKEKAPARADFIDEL